MKFEENDFENKLKLVFETIQEVNERAYRDIFLISNQVLSKSPYSNNYLKKMVFNKSKGRSCTIKIGLKVAKYYLKSLLLLAVHASASLIYLASGSRWVSIPDMAKELIVIDTFFSGKKIQKTKKYEDRKSTRLNSSHSERL